MVCRLTPMGIIKNPKSSPTVGIFFARSLRSAEPFSSPTTIPTFLHRSHSGRFFSDAHHLHLLSGIPHTSVCSQYLDVGILCEFTESIFQRFPAHDCYFFRRRFSRSPPDSIAISPFILTDPIIVGVPISAIHWPPVPPFPSAKNRRSIRLP